MTLTDDQWRLIQPLLPPPSPALRGRPLLDDRRILDAILWKFSNNIPWYDLLEGFPSYQTCYRRYRFWLRRGVLSKIQTALYQDLRERGGFDLHQAIHRGLIDLRRRPGRWEWRNDPSLDGTWQLATAQAVLGLAMNGLRRSGP